MGVLTAIAASQGWWIAALLLVCGVALVIALTILISTRYLARLVRTEARKMRIANKQLAERFQADASSHQDRVLKQTRNALQDHNRKIDLCHAEIHKIDEFKNEVRKMSRTQTSHVTSTARHSASETEALLQIYSRFPNTKLPMPSSGGWAIDAQSLAYLISLVQEKRPKRILELGSGTSTIWLGYLCQTFGGKLITLDHLDHYLEQTQAAIRRHELDDVIESRLAPLERIEQNNTSFDWYSTDVLKDVMNVDMVVVDGPPAATGKNARYPALPQLIHKLAPEATIVLDDAHRPDESEILAEWQAQFPDFTRLTIGTARLAILERDAK